MTYQLEGRMSEFCTCYVPCPCSLGEDPDGGTCEGVLAWHIDKGSINDIDVSGLTIALVVDLPGNGMNGNWKAAGYVSDTASQKQSQLLKDIWSGKLGGPVGDLVGLIGEMMGWEQVPISFDMEKGEGNLTIGDIVEGTMAPMIGALGERVTLSDSVFATYPGAPTYVAKASNYRRDARQHGFKPIHLQGRNATLVYFRFAA